MRTVTGDAHACAARPGARETKALPAARLLGVGTALPTMRWRQAEIGERLASLWGLRSAKLDRWRRILAGTMIEARHGVMALDDVMPLTTAQRMAAYEGLAPPLAIEAAEQALRSAGVSRGAVSDLIVVSCTGFSAPGLDAAVIRLMGLNADVRRTLIGFMGCSGAINGLRSAAATCAADADAVALVVCVELCTLHVRPETDDDNLVASALFGDGAAAAVVAGSSGEAGDFTEALGCLDLGSSRLLHEGRDWMTWRITDRGFAMSLSREVPGALASSLRAFMQTMRAPSPRTHLVHPGGAAILEAVEEALGPSATAGLSASREVLRRSGNLSSGTLLFVMDEAMRRGLERPAALLAFGPGLTIEGLSLLSDPAGSESPHVPREP
jgi:predicted naringenin-chalcone synthase